MIKRMPCSRLAVTDRAGGQAGPHPCAIRIGPRARRALLSGASKLYVHLVLFSVRLSAEIVAPGGPRARVSFGASKACVTPSPCIKYPERGGAVTYPFSAGGESSATGRDTATSRVASKSHLVVSLGRRPRRVLLTPSTGQKRRNSLRTMPNFL